MVASARAKRCSQPGSCWLVRMKTNAVAPSPMLSGSSNAARLLGASLACFVHGLFPFLFTSTGSATVKRLYQGMVVARPAQRSVSPQLERAGIAAAVDQ